MDVIWDSRDVILKSFWLTVQLLVISGVASMVVGTFLVTARVSPIPVVRGVGVTYVSIFRNIPLLMVFVLVVEGAPRIGLMADVPFLLKGCIALTIYTSAFVCEALRAGVNSVSLGQAEAARSIGLTFRQSMGQVILPQATRAALPPLTSVFIALAKNTSVAAGFGLVEATARFKSVKKFVPGEADTLVLFAVIALGYIIIVEVMSFGSNRLERRWRLAR
ncbi:amino acid ABC transporter permease [Solicola gregarius]|uniref:Amino acid ABC transporter permease n=1 Tax=Solicola gregarius TaxID=2908642 RepID=A0AA46TG80_9ACTN|nr:amino acid ABC transporter permease [Solicola gregarius]UYM04565.1 amino acid ABC transporter permease [Solicola gregarius]